MSATSHDYSRSSAVDIDVVVWNVDARNKPDLEVDIAFDLAPDEIPGEHHAILDSDLEVDITSDRVSRD